VFFGFSDEPKDGLEWAGRQCVILGMDGLDCRASNSADGVWGCQILAVANEGQTAAYTNG